MAEIERLSGPDTRSTVMRAAVGAVATTAATYGVQRWLASRQDRPDEAQRADSHDDDHDENEGDERGWSDKRDELTQALTSKAAEAKKAAAKLRPGSPRRSSPAHDAWEIASPHLLRVAKEAASALGATAAEKAPDVVRKDLVPSFIDGFEKGT